MFRAKLATLKELLFISDDIDFAIDPVFLDYEPVNTVEQKRWLHQKISEIAPNEPGELFLALQKLLS